MKTRDRILEQSILLFNDRGTSSISSLDIADTIGISPGNLYYHFKGKEAILTNLLKECDLAIERLTVNFMQQDFDSRSLTRSLYALMQVCHHYHFMFRDQEMIRFASKDLNRKWGRLLSKLRGFTTQYLHQLNINDSLGLSEAEQIELADNLLLIALGYFSFGRVLQPDINEEQLIFNGVARLAKLLHPYRARACAAVTEVETS